MNNTPITPPEFGVYTISKDYIAYLRKAEPSVMDPNATNTYCGPVARRDTERGPVDYFVPIDVGYYSSHDYFVSSFLDGVYEGVFDFTKMIPCLPSEYKYETSNEKLTKFCKNDEAMLKTYANNILDEQEKQRSQK